MTEEDKNDMCEAYFHIEDEHMTNGVNVTSRKVTIQGIGNTMDEARTLFDHVKKEMKM